MEFVQTQARLTSSQHRSFGQRRAMCILGASAHHREVNISEYGMNLFKKEHVSKLPVTEKMRSIVVCQVVFHLRQFVGAPLRDARR